MTAWTTEKNPPVPAVYLFFCQAFEMYRRRMPFEGKTWFVFEAPPPLVVLGLAVINTLTTPVLSAYPNLMVML